MRNPILIFVLFIVSAMAHANPAPFGLEIGKTTVAEAKKQYGGSATGINKYSGGPMLDVRPSKVDFAGLQELTLIFNRNDVLVGVLATLPKNQFRQLHQLLADKYPVESQRIPFVGDSYARYKAGETIITLNAPHMSFQMTMHYLHKELNDAFERISRQEEAERKRSTASQL